MWGFTIYQLIELRVPDASYEKHLAEILAKKLPKVIAIFACENYPVCNGRSELYSRSEQCSYIDYGRGKKKMA